MTRDDCMCISNVVVQKPVDFLADLLFLILILFFTYYPSIGDIGDIVEIMLDLRTLLSVSSTWGTV